MIHKQAHTYDGERLVLFAFSIPAQVIGLFQFKEVIRAVVIKYILSALNDFLAVFIKLCLYKIIFLREDRKSPVNIMEFKGGLFYKPGSLFIGSQL